MSGFLEDCVKYFSTRNLYELLNIDKSAELAAVKKAYYKLSLKVHPDRAEKDDKTATKKFQILSRVYSILSDKDKRAIYDESGNVDDESVPERDWNDYWRLMFKKITPEDIEKFKKEYQGSKEEVNDIQETYVKFKGDMDKITQCIMCFEIDDEPRIRTIIDDLIENETVSEYKMFTEESAKKKQKRRNKAESERRKVEAESGNSFGDLHKAIARKQKEREGERDDFLKNLEAKYCTKKPKAKRLKKNNSDDENSEEVQVPKKSAKKASLKTRRTTRSSKK